MAEWLLQECEVAVNPVDRFHRTPLEVRDDQQQQELAWWPSRPACPSSGAMHM